MPEDTLDQAAAGLSEARSMLEAARQALQDVPASELGPIVARIERIQAEVARIEATLAARQVPAIR